MKLHSSIPLISYVEEQPEVWNQRSQNVTLHLTPTEEVLPAGTCKLYGKHICARDKVS